MGGIKMECIIKKISYDRYLATISIDEYYPGAYCIGNTLEEVLEDIKGLKKYWAKNKEKIIATLE